MKKVLGEIFQPAKWERIGIDVRRAHARGTRPPFKRFQSGSASGLRNTVEIIARFERLLPPGSR